MKKVELIGKLGLFVLVFMISFYGFSNIFYPKNNEEISHGDEYTYRFDEKTIENEKLVVYDNRGLDFIRYFVFNCSSDGYILYTYNYMGNRDSYLNKYAEVSSRIVDYRYSEYMIKTLDSTGPDTYQELVHSINNDDFYIIY